MSQTNNTRINKPALLTVTFLLVPNISQDKLYWDAKIQDTELYRHRNKDKPLEVQKNATVEFENPKWFIELNKFVVIVIGEIFIHWI